MTPSIAIKFDDLESALLWVSAGSPLENAAYISRATGRIFYASSFHDSDEDLPEDVEDASLYWSVPHRNDLDLGTRLALRYIEEVLPNDCHSVEAYFQHRGAYALFKNLLERRGKLEHWHAYEAGATEAALLEWARDHALPVIPKPPGSTA